MKKSTTLKRNRPTQKRGQTNVTKKINNLRRLPYLALVGMGIFVVLIGTAIFNFNLTEKPNANAFTALPIEKFEMKYAGYNPGTAWMSWLSDLQRCSSTEVIYGAKPTTAGNYPTLVYLHGTTADSNKNKEGQKFIELAAAQGFVALAATYDSGSSIRERDLNRHAYCMFGDDNQGSLKSTICSHAKVDCSDGILMSGFSQGAAIALIAKNYEPSVKALWAIGLSGYIYRNYDVPSDSFAPPLGTRALPNDKLVINMGEASNIFSKKLAAADLPSLKQMTGNDCGNEFDCIQANGSGYYVIKNAEIKDGVADHCYWLMVNKWSTGMSCTKAPKELDPGFQPPTTTKWSMLTNLNWLREQL